MSERFAVEVVLHLGLLPDSCAWSLEARQQAGGSTHLTEKLVAT